MPDEVAADAVAELLGQLDAAAAVVRTDDGVKFAACHSLALETWQITQLDWVNDLEQTLWLLDDGLDFLESHSLSDFQALAFAAAAEWQEARSPDGEGVTSYVRRWLAFIRRVYGPGE